MITKCFIRFSRLSLLFAGLCLTYKQPLPTYLLPIFALSKLKILKHQYSNFPNNYRIFTSIVVVMSQMWNSLVIQSRSSLNSENLSWVIQTNWLRLRSSAAMLVRSSIISMLNCDSKFLRYFWTDNYNIGVSFEI